MRVLPVCALLVVSAIATQTQPATKVAPNEDGKDAKDYTPWTRRQRSAVIVGKSMMTALRAVKDLLFGSKQIPSVTEYKLHAKQGGIGRALEDFESVDLKNIQHYTSTAQFGRSGQIGNRQIVLRYSQITQTPSIDIIKLHKDAKPGSSLPGTLTDRIIYTKHLFW